MDLNLIKALRVKDNNFLSYALSSLNSLYFDFFSKKGKKKATSDFHALSKQF